MELVHSIAEGKPHDDTDVQFLSQSCVSKRLQQQQQHQTDNSVDILLELDQTRVEQVVNNATKYKALNALYQIISSPLLVDERERIANQVVTILRNSCLPSAGGNTRHINAQCFHSATLTGNVVVVKELLQNASSPMVILKGLKTTFNYTFDMIGKCHPRRLNCIQLASMLGYTELVEIFHSNLESNVETAAMNIFNVPVVIPTVVANDDDVMIAHRLTPLMLATRFGHVHTVRKLLELKVQSNGSEYDVNFKSHSGYTALHFAACYNQVDCLQALIELGGADVNATTYGYVKYPLAFCAGLGYFEITRKLVHTTERKGLELAVHVAAALGRDRDVGILLMAHSSLLQAKDRDGNSLLAVALKADNASTVDILLYRSINFDSREDAVREPNDSGNESIGLSDEMEPKADSEKNLEDDATFTRPKTSTARVLTRFMKILRMRCLQSKRQQAHNVDMLYNAVYRNNLELIEELLLLGVDPNQTDRNGNNFLHLAADENRSKIIDSFLFRFEHLSEMKNAQGETPLHIAARKGHESAVKSLIRNTATLGLSDNDGRTPLLLAARYHQEIVMNVLVKAIQSTGWYELLNARDAGRRTALHYAVSFHKLPECRCISILSGLDPSSDDQKSRSVDGDTSGSVLHISASMKNPELLKQVLKTFYSSSERSRRCDVDCTDISGRTALMVCVDNEDIDGVETLLNYDVNLEARDFNGLTILHRIVLHSVQGPEKALTMLQIFQAICQHIARKKGDLDTISTVGSGCQWCRRTDDDKLDEDSRRTHLLTHLFSPMTRFSDNASTEPLSMSALQLAAAVGAEEMMQAFVNSINRLDTKASGDLKTKPDERKHENHAIYSPSHIVPTVLYSDQCVLDGSPNQLSALELIIYIGHRNAVNMTATRPLNAFFHRFSRLRSIVFCLLSLCHVAHMIAFSWAVVPTCVRYTSTLHDRPAFTCFLIWPTMVFLYLILRLAIFLFRLLTGRTKNYTYRYLISMAGDFGTVFKYTIFKTINYLSGLIFFACNVAWLVLWGKLDNLNFLRYAQMVSVIVIIGWFHTMEYIKGIKYFHSFSKYIKLIIFKDIFRFAVVYFLVLIGFSLALQVYVQLDVSVSPGVNGNATIVDTVFSTFGLMIGMTSVYGTEDSDYMHVGFLYDGSNPISSKILITLYLCLTTIILLNVLIAMLNSSYTMIDEEIQLLWIYENMMLACNLAGSGLWFIEAPVRWLMRWMVFADKSGTLVVDLDKKSRTRSMLKSN